MEKPKHNRCHHDSCKKKVSLMGIVCKCGYKYCVTHSLPEIHNCTYDFKCKENLEKKLIKVESVKVLPI